MLQAEINNCIEFLGVNFIANLAVLLQRGKKCQFTAVNRKRAPSFSVKYLLFSMHLFANMLFKGGTRFFITLSP